ncbi:MAG: FkbM family methyltransferase [Thalassobaculaceae bacterium]
MVNTPFGIFEIDPTDTSVSRTLQRFGEYGRRELEALDMFLEDSKNVLVLGAHIGTMVVPIAGKVETVDAVEANPRNFDLLRKNIDFNQLTNVQIHQKFISHSKKKVRFIDDVHFTAGSKIFPKKDISFYKDKDARIIEVEADSVDALFPGKHFDLILCDIEGAEIDALKGMTETLKAAKCLGIEFMPHHLRNVSGASVEDFLENLWDFQTLYSPRLKRAAYRDGFTALLTLMFENDAHDECLIFHKNRLAITKATA